MKQKIRWHIIFAPFLYLSSRLETAGMDWMRSIYFSLFGAYTFLFIQNYSGYDKAIRNFSFLTSLFLFLGIIISIIIILRFRRIDAKYEKLPEPKTQTRKQFYIIREVEWLFKFHHFLFWGLFFISGFFAIKSGKLLTNKSHDLKYEEIRRLESIEIKVDSLLNINIKALSVQNLKDTSSIQNTK